MREAPAEESMHFLEEWAATPPSRRAAGREADGGLATFGRWLAAGAVAGLVAIGAVATTSSLWQPAAAATAAQAASPAVAALHQARAALSSGDTALTLAILNAYDQSFPRVGLDPEATFLRIQALSQSGNTIAARGLATRFLSEHPTSLHATHVRLLMAPPSAELGR